MICDNRWIIWGKKLWNKYIINTHKQNMANMTNKNKKEVIKLEKMLETDGKNYNSKDR